HAGQCAGFLQAGPECAMQAQGDVGVLGGVGCGLLQGDLVEGQLFRALAGDVLEAGGACAQVLQCQAVHIVTGGGGVQDVGFEHAVKGHAAHFDAIVGQYVDVVLGVLCQLGSGGVLQQ